MDMIENIRRRFEALSPHLDDKGLLLFVASGTLPPGRGGVSLVSTATGVARSTIARALAEPGEEPGPSGRVRRPGRDRKRAREVRDGLGEAPDLIDKQGWVSVGTSCDRAAFAVESIRRWWQRPGKGRYPGTRKLLITADCGGSNGSRVRFWKVGLQKQARELDLEISMCHLPPGTGKWNRIEYRLFSFISQNWRGMPLYSLTTIINLIGSTTANIKIGRSEMDAPDIRRNDFHGDWNYALLPVPDGVSVIS